MCCFLSEIEEGINDKLAVDANLVPWVVRWAAMCHSRYAVGKDGRTGYETLRLRTCRAMVVPIGEKVWYRQIRPGMIRQNKAETE